MTEQEIRDACKYVIEYGDRQFTDVEKQLLKNAVDEAKNLEELFTVALVSLGCK